MEAARMVEGGEGMKPMPWIKLSPQRLHDARLAMLNDRQQLRFHQLYLLAGHCNSEGAFLHEGKQLTHKEIAYILRVKDADQLAKDIATLKKAGLLKANGHGPYIADFKEEQINWVEKQRADRERQARKRHGGVTRDTGVSHDDVTLLEQEQEEDKDLVVVVGDAYREKIGKTSTHISMELEKIVRSGSGKLLLQAINISADQGKESLAYVKGVLRNLKNGTEKPAPHGKRGASQPPAKKLDSRQTKL